MPEKLWYLKRCDLFEQLSAEQLQRLERCSRLKVVERGEPVYLPADAAQAVFLVLAGRVRIFHITLDGKQSILAFIDPGEMFGELAVLDAGPRDEYAEATVKSSILRIPTEDLQQVMRETPEVSLRVTKLIGLRRRRIERRLKQLLFLSNRERLIHLLLDLAEQYGTATPQGVNLNVRLSHQDLANVIGSTRETVTVVLGELQVEDLVEIGRRRLVLTSPSRLAEEVRRELPSFAPPGAPPFSMPQSETPSGKH